MLTGFLIVAMLSNAAPGEAVQPVSGHLAAGSVQLVRVDWALEAHGAADAPRVVPDGIEITARFDPEDHSIRGRAGCNSFFAAYEVDGDRLSTTDMGVTQMMCGPEVMEHEDAFLRILSLVERYEISDDRLTLRASENRVLVFRRSES